MNQTEKHHRFDELSAGLAMGDLSHEEARELTLLADELGLSPDGAFEVLAATMESEFLRSAADPLPAALAARLEQHAETMAAPTQGKVLQLQVSTWRKILGNPLTGWAAAAAIALLAWVGPAIRRPDSPAKAEQRLRAEAGDLLERPFSGLGSFAATSGTVIWSDRAQQGYMTLHGVPANNPQKAQYQLWIVDPKRDEAPVDGGVFDIPAGGGAVVIPIAAKLAIHQPQAFVITLEQPGGVVKSKQEQVVALAKN